MLIHQSLLKAGIRPDRAGGMRADSLDKMDLRGTKIERMVKKKNTIILVVSVCIFYLALCSWFRSFILLRR
jgi:hypothetical protein